MTTVGELKTYVRAYLDIDIEDLPDVLMDPWIQQGYNEMVGAEKRWPSLEKDATFETTTDEQRYLLGEGGSIVDCRQQDVEFVSLIDYALHKEDHDRLRQMYPESSAVVGKPSYYSLWRGYLWLWPTPSAGLTVSVSYYRRPTEWLAVGAGAEPDLPDEFHLPLQEYVLAHAYLQQEDSELADAHLKNFGRMFSTAKKAETRASPQQPIILNGGRHRRTLRRMRYPFDFGGSNS